MRVPRIFSVGDMNVDLFTHTGKFPGFGTEGHAEMFHCTLGGNAANFAAACASLGLDTTLVSVGGSGFFSGFIMRELKRLRIRPLLGRSKLPIGVSNIFVRPDGERAILSNKGCLSDIDAGIVSRVLLPKLSEGDIVLFGGFFHLPKMRRGFAKLLKAIHRRNALVVFDACYDEYGSWKISGFAKHIDILLLNEVELRKITRAKTVRAGIRKLYAMGARHVVLKRGQRGAADYAIVDGANAVYSPALGVKASNATGAGDFFNAGYIYGVSNSFSPLNCLRCGNFAASRKVSSSEYCPALKSPLGEYLGAQNLTEIVVKNGNHAVVRNAARRVISLLKTRPGAVISLAAGKTPVGVYRGLVRAYRKGEADFSGASFVELDEYAGLSDERDSFAFQLRRNFLDRVNFRKGSIFLFNGKAKSAARECRRMEAIVNSRGLDLALLGIGENAHIAFNEPGSPFSSKTRVVSVPRNVLRARGARFGGAKPLRAFTLGISTIMRAKEIILIANGRRKALAIARSFGAKPNTRAPASVLQHHSNSCVIVDSPAAAKLLKQND